MWALITGGSSGMGLEYARQLAGRGYDLLLVSNRDVELKAASAQLREQYSQKHYGRPYHRLTTEERSLVNDYYPQRISESLQEKGGGQ